MRPVTVPRDGFFLPAVSARMPARSPELGRPAVFFDDVVTTGSQMIGSYRRLAKEGFPVLCGVTVGRATKEQKEPMLGWSEEQIAVEDVPIDWSALFD